MNLTLVGDRPAHAGVNPTAGPGTRSPCTNYTRESGTGADRLRLPIDAAAGGADQTVERLVRNGRRRQLAPVRAGYPHQTPEAVVVPRQPERRADQSRARLEVDAHPSATPGGAAEVARKGGRHSRSIPPARVAVARGAATDGQVRARVSNSRGLRRATASEAGGDHAGLGVVRLRRKADRAPPPASRPRRPAPRSRFPLRT